MTNLKKNGSIYILYFVSIMYVPINLYFYDMLNLFSQILGSAYSIKD